MCALNNRNIETKWNDKNLKLLNRYKELNLIPFSFSLTENEKGIKDLITPKHGSFTKYDENLINSKNGLAIKTGAKIDNDNYLILVDIDNKNDTINKWYSLLKTHNNNKNYYKTPYASTGNDGLHYLFKISFEKFRNLKSSYGKINIENEKLDIDIKSYNQMCIVEPTKYKSYDGRTIKKYQWIKESIYKYGIMDIPEWIYKELINNNSLQPIRNQLKIMKTTETKKINKINDNNHYNDTYEKLKLDMFIDFKNKPTQEEIDYFNCFSFERLNNYDDWINCAFLCYSLYNIKTGFFIFDHLSKISLKYNNTEILKEFNGIIKKDKLYTKGSLLHFAEIDNKDEYDIIKSKYTPKIDIILYDDYPFNIDKDTVFINQRYLLNQSKGLNDTTEICKTIKRFFKSKNINTLCIKSPYDTGKTQLLKQILNEYKPIRILWLSTRVTYTYDILKNFKETHNFKSYFNENELTANRLIVQIESILKIPFNKNFVVPTYDLIILDEIESILKQFSSSTFKNNVARKTFEYLYAIINLSIKNNGKIIALDGDLAIRSMHYLDSFGPKINIVNEVNFNRFHINITQNIDVYESEIFEALNDSKNIVIASMSAEYATSIQHKILDKYSQLKIKLYTSSSDSDEIKKLQNVNELWKECNVLIYSPTISSGVSFDIPHFHKLFGVISNMSCSERDFHQMLRRIRKIEDTDILIFNYSLLKLNDKMLYETYEKTKKYYIDTTEINELELYDIITIYNIVETENSCKSIFLKSFLSRAVDKGYKYTLLEDKAKTSRSSFKKQEIIKAYDILTAEVYEEFYSKIKNKEEERYMKLAITKYYAKYILGVDILNMKILNNYYNKYDLIYNYLGLLCINNIKDNDNIKDKELLKQIPIIKDLINRLGFSNMFDSKTIITEQILNENIKKLERENIFSYDQMSCRYFKTFKKYLVNLFDETIEAKNINIEDKDLKPKDIKIKYSQCVRKVRYVNKCLRKFLLKIDIIVNVINQEDVKLLFRLVDIKSIREIIFYKINKGSYIYDDDHILKKPDTYIYNDLIKELGDQEEYNKIDYIYKQKLNDKKHDKEDSKNIDNILCIHNDDIVYVNNCTFNHIKQSQFIEKHI